MDAIERIAVIGMQGRFSGARNLDEFWKNLRNGIESVTTFTEEELATRGVPDYVFNDPHYVKSGTVLEDIDLFDAKFFGMSPREAATTDPQQRLFLEVAWESLEGAGYDPETYDGMIGVFAGAGVNNYVKRFWEDEADPVSAYRQMIGNNLDYLSTRVSYLLDLKGPSLTVQTACSTSLVAVHLACQSLLTYQSDMALAGGVGILLPQGTGYLYEEGMILSPDGQCRAFDANGRGIYGGRGLGIVVLKRLSEALEDGDSIRAVINGSALNNDGAAKIGYTAPSIDGQAEVITTALALGQTHPETIQYIEAHGTGTPLGDPIEVQALTRAFRASTDKKQYCAIGSVKTNVGHLDAAAGVTGLIKTVLALENREIPPSLNFQEPNPEIDFVNSPFYVNDTLQPWPEQDGPRRAGVSSFGIGGTNAHVVLEEAPATTATDAGRSPQLILLSARTPAALDATTDNLRAHLEQLDATSLTDVCYTLQVGRKRFPHRRMLVCTDTAEAADLLQAADPKHVITGGGAPAAREVAFVFSGQGSQYVNMGRELYDTETVFRHHVDQCAELLADHLGLDIRSLIFANGAVADAAEQLQQTSITQPALFTIEYALAQLWMSWGVSPRAMAGHSIGEYVAGCLAGVFSLHDGLALVADRGRLMQTLPSGSMLAVPLPEPDLVGRLDGSLSLAAVNAPQACVVSGPYVEIDELEQALRADGIEARRLHTSHAFHSPMMDPMLEPFTEMVREVQLQAPSIPFVSNVTGTWIKPEEATDPGYWARHIRQTVRFADCVSKLLADPHRALLEVGPGNTLTTLARRSPVGRDRTVLPSLPHPKESIADSDFITTTVGRLWLSGIELDWRAWHGPGARRRVRLPTYPFERDRFWIEETERSVPASSRPPKSPNLGDWFYLPSWERTTWNRPSDSVRSWLLFTDDIGTRVAERLREKGHNVTEVSVGDQYSLSAEGAYTINPASPGDYVRLVEALTDRGKVPELIAHFWSLSDDPSLATIGSSQLLGFYSLVYLAQALHQKDVTSPIKLSVMTGRAQEVDDRDRPSAVHATILGAVKVIPQEYGNISSQSIDLMPSEAHAWDQPMLDRLIGELADDESSGDEVAYRGRHRWLRTYRPLPLNRTDGRPQMVRERGVYLITGGLGGVGLAMAQYLARVASARLVLIGRTKLPPHEEWEAYPAGSGINEVAERGIHSVLALEELGAEVLVLQADVGNREQMEVVIAKVDERFGEIHGVIHAAGITPSIGSGAIEKLDHAACEEQFHSKIHGLVVLDDVLGDRPVDFCLLTSSLSTVLGGLGFAAYAAANSFMDAFALDRSRVRRAQWLSVNWDGWQLNEDELGKSRVVAMTREEGLEAFARLLSIGETNRVVVSAGPLQPRIDQWVGLHRERASAVTEGRQSLGTDGDGVGGEDAPRNETEATLAAIWQELLGVERVGIHDDYYDLGGDSLIGMNIVTRANKAGIRLTPTQLLDHPTIAELASTSQGPHDANAEQGIVVGEVPLTPNALRFLVERDTPDPHHWNVSVLLTVPVAIDWGLLAQALQHVYEHHDSLRLRIAHDGSEWHQHIVGSDTQVPFGSLDLSDFAAPDQDGRLKQLVIEQQGSLNLADGPLLRLARFDLGERGQRVLIVVHHLAAEGRSVSVLLEDLDAAYRQLSRGGEVQLPAKTTSVKQWAETLRDMAHSPEWSRHLDHWLTAPWPDVRPLPVDLADGLNVNSSGREIIRSLAPEEGERLGDFSLALGYSVEEVLLAALAWTLEEWTDSKTVLFDRIGHGRASLSSDMDLSRTVGFFLSYTPLIIEMPQADGDSESLDRIISQVRLDRDQALSFDVLRWMSSEGHPARRLRDVPRAQVSFNYRGPSEQWVEQGSIFSLAPESDLAWKSNHSPRGIRYYPLGVIVDREDDGLVFRFVYSNAVHEQPTIEDFAASYLGKLRAFGGQLAAQ